MRILIFIAGGIILFPVVGCIILWIHYLTKGGMN